MGIPLIDEEEFGSYVRRCCRAERNCALDQGLWSQHWFGRAVKWDDHLSGATRYLTHTMSFHMTDSISHDIIDAPLQMAQRFDICRQAKFHCKCCPNITNVEQTSFGNRGFCKRCSFLVYRTNISHVTRCPGCNINDSWETIGHPCLACQVATIVHRNPFQARYEAQIQMA